MKKIFNANHCNRIKISIQFQLYKYGMEQCNQKELVGNHDTPVLFAINSIY